jgi:hypothetical protein
VLDHGAYPRSVLRSTRALPVTPSGDVRIVPPAPSPRRRFAASAAARAAASVSVASSGESGSGTPGSSVLGEEKASSQDRSPARSDADRELGRRARAGSRTVREPRPRVPLLLVPPRKFQARGSACRQGRSAGTETARDRRPCRQTPRGSPVQDVRRHVPKTRSAGVLFASARGEGQEAPLAHHRAGTPADRRSRGPATQASLAQDVKR